MHDSGIGPLSFGQLHFWRDVEGLPRERWHEVNAWSRWSLGGDVGTERVRAALHALAARCPSLHTTYDLSDPAAPRQVLTTADDVEITATETGSEEENHAVAADVLDRPFDLRAQPAWRALIRTDGTRATEVLLVRHHIVADGPSDGVLAHEFRTFLDDPAATTEPMAGPLDLARWQRAPEQERARAAAVEHWEKALSAEAGRGFPGVDPARTGPLQGVLQSSAAHAKAHELAAATRTSLSSVVLGVYTLAIARVTGSERLAAGSECANRFDPRWRNVVSSMVQPVPIPVTAKDDLPAHITSVHRAAMTAYRRGMYDVDSVAALAAAGGHKATCEYNFFPWLEFAERRSDDPEPVWEEPTAAIRDGCLLRAAEKGGTLKLCLRTRGIDEDRAVAVMKHMQALLS